MDWGECSVKLFRLTKENKKEGETGFSTKLKFQIEDFVSCVC